MRDDPRNYVVEHLGDEDSGVLVVDETGFLKKGKKSVGVARQYTGTAGETVNCQVGVLLAYASERGPGFVDRSLYLPRGWTSDPSWRAEAGVPEQVTFTNKIELAKRQEFYLRMNLKVKFYPDDGPIQEISGVPVCQNESTSNSSSR